MDKRLTITDVAKALGVTSRTIMRWEKAGKIKKSKRDWRGWRFYYEEDLKSIKEFFESSYELDTTNGELNCVAKSVVTIILALSVSAASYILCSSAYGDYNFTTRTPAPSEAVIETPTTVDINLDALAPVNTPPSLLKEDIRYTLGPDDVISIIVRRHPEFSGEYKINSEGKIEYRFVGDIIVEGLTKVGVKERLSEILSEYIIEPDIDVTIVAYLSKVFYVVGDVRNPGKFYMRGNTVSVREAIMQSGLPTQAAAMRRCRLITPDDNNKNNYIDVNIYSLLFEGNLKENQEMQPGDVLYVPSTVMAKIIRVISPATNVAGQAAGTAARAIFLVP